MIVEIILGLLIGYFAAPNKKVGFLLGFVGGAIWGVIAVHLVLGMEGRSMDGVFLAIMIVVEGVITGLFALLAAHNKMKKRAKSMQNFTEKFD